MAAKPKKEIEPSLNIASNSKIDNFLKEISKQHGEKTVMRMDEENSMRIDSVSSGSIALNRAIGIGGYPKGRIIEIFGGEASGKTTMMLHLIAESQKISPENACYFIDMEHALDPKYAEKIGVQMSRLYVSQPDTGEQALELAEKAVRSGAFSVVVIDSVAALVPRAEIEGDMGDSHMGLQARLMGQALRKITGAVNNEKTILAFTNQTRDKIGVMFGSPVTTTGGKALPFYASIRLEVKKIETLKSGEESIGNRVKVTVKKNKMAPPFREAEIDVIFGEGISKTSEIVDIATELSIIEKRGAFYRYGETLLGQGKENAKKFLRENPLLMFELELCIYISYGMDYSNLPLSYGIAQDVAETILLKVMPKEE